MTETYEVNARHTRIYACREYGHGRTKRVVAVWDETLAPPIWRPGGLATPLEAIMVQAVRSSVRVAGATELVDRMSARVAGELPWRADGAAI